MINGTAADALSALRLMIAGRLRVGLSMTLPSLARGNCQDKSRTGSSPFRGSRPNRRKTKQTPVDVCFVLVDDQGLELWFGV